MENESKIVDRMAEALYKHALQEAKKAIDSHGFDAKDLVEISKKMSSETMTAKVIVFGSYIEEKTVDLMKIHLSKINSKEEEECIFGFNGPLGTFSARINMAYFLGWIPKGLQKDLHAFRKIRNAFAHEAYKISISDQKVSSLVDSIDVDIDKEISNINKAISPNKMSSDLSADERFIFKMIYVAGMTFTCFLAGPAAKAFRVQPRSLLADFDSMPEVFKEIRRNMARSLAAAIPIEGEDLVPLIVQDNYSDCVELNQSEVDAKQ